MSGFGFQKASKVILTEIGGSVAGVREEQAEAFVEGIVQAGAVFTTGEGRSGLVARCFAMRLMQLGLRAFVVGETVTPALGSGDLLVVVSGRGESEIACTRARLASEHGGRVAAVTGHEGSRLGRAADLVLVIPAVEGAGEGHAQYGGSQFEQSALVVLDAVAMVLQKRLGHSDEDMDARHATVE